jgi:hypothetical protein
MYIQRFGIKYNKFDKDLRESPKPVRKETGSTIALALS